MNRPRILVIPELFPEYDGDWKGVFILDFIRALRGMAFITVFHSRPWGNEAGMRRETIGKTEVIHFFPFLKNNVLPKPIAYKLWEISVIREIKKLGKFDLIHAHGSAFHGMIAKYLANHFQIPYCVTEHTGPFSSLMNRILIKGRVSSALKNASAVFAVSRYQKKCMENYKLTVKNILVSGNPVDTSFFKPVDNPLRKYILFAGRLDRFKGAMRVLRAYHFVFPDLFPLKLIIAGEGEDNAEIENYIRENELEHAVEQLPMQSRNGLRNLMQHAMMVVLPSEFETFGLIGIEAVACGTPVILGTSTGPADYFSTDFGVGLDNVFDELSISAAMVYIFQNQEKFNAGKMHQQVEEKFGYSAFASRMAATYSNLIES